MRISRIIGGIAPLACVLLLLSATPAGAADVYLAGTLGISSAAGDARGFNSLAGVSSSGTGNDSSPVYGTALGMLFPLNAALPWRMRIPGFAIPYWPGRALRYEGSEDASFPSWQTRFELEWLGGRDFEISSPGANASLPYRSDVSGSSLMAVLRLDVPVQAPITAMFGRIPIFEPLSIFGGGGVGIGFTKVKASDTVVSGSQDSMGLAYQVTAGMGYALTESVHWSVGWRYVDLGDVSMTLTDGLTDRGSFSIDLGAHEFTTALRFSFWRIPFLGGE
jgi:opacity protein-like surface antigen